MENVFWWTIQCDNFNTHPIYNAVVSDFIQNSFFRIPYSNFTLFSLYSCFCLCRFSGHFYMPFTNVLLFSKCAILSVSLLNFSNTSFISSSPFSSVPPTLMVPKHHVSFKSRDMDRRSSQSLIIRSESASIVKFSTESCSFDLSWMMAFSKMSRNFWSSCSTLVSIFSA